MCNELMLDTFGRRLTLALAQNEMTQAELSRRLGVSEASVSRWVNGWRVPLSPSLMDISRILDVSPWWLMNGRDETRKES